MNHKNPNPQGKGLSPVLEGLMQSRARIPLPPKQIDQIAGELFTSLFVLNSSFSFRPVVGRSYWLYRVDGSFRLYLLSPSDWSAGYPGRFIGECVLQDDITWTLTLDEAAANDESLLQYLERERRRLEVSLQQTDSLQEAMPVYVESLPFYSRLLAYGLGSSLRVSMQAAGISTLGYDEARGLLGHEQQPDDN